MLVERFKISFQISKSNWVFEKDVASKYSLQLPQLGYTRFPRAVQPMPAESVRLQWKSTVFNTYMNRSALHPGCK